ncbi:MAG: RNA 2',3'-cyclic phosphodiesterase [Paracoccaceae bacterium]
MRAFVAIPMPDDTADALIRLQRRLAFGKPVGRGNLHLTLAFLDDHPEDMLQELDHDLQGLQHPAFDVELAGLGRFGQAMYMNVARTDPLETLHTQVVSACRRSGIVLRRRRFHPHVTLARLQKGQSAPPMRHGVDELGSFELAVTSFALVESILHPKGARHDILAAYPLSEVPLMLG